ncbi:helix-turn-helix transcriptional regulator [Tenacibaculum sp. Mcav3-52]|uniref:helix-turn-helix domain-containing protein n=1 Tax=Tenacibaculum sp. Mcav3-52 TaxID=2917762 RepID=UPI001EF33ADE|nr:helix-turn-helix transcriptional regulator [Tenacibaculum sp. Mcav3-52]MCG7500602.1 helix-turn-helix transcriptional regulator [Tenacibaculum sp. Mcav3-52]
MLTKKQEQEILVSIGKKIREVREERGLTQFNLAYDADLSKNQIGRVERGENKLSIIAIIKIAKALNVHISELLSFDIIKE